MPSNPPNPSSSHPTASPQSDGAAPQLLPRIDTDPTRLPSNDPRAFLSTPQPLSSPQPTAITEADAITEKNSPAAASPTRSSSDLTKSTTSHPHPADLPRPLNTLKHFDRFLKSLPLPLRRLVPSFVARAIYKVLRSQNLMASNLAFDIALLFWRIIINLFFREIRPRSSWRIPKQGPIIFVVAPHHNQFLDPLLLASEVRKASGRRVASLIAKKSIERPFIGTAAKVMQSIPVARALDNTKPGTGTISVHPSGDPLLIQGHGTAFISELMAKGQIVLPKEAGSATAEVVEIISDTEIRIKKEFKDQRTIDMLNRNLPQDVSKRAQNAADLASATGCKYQCLPFVDQTQMYARVYEKLADGGCLGIFPEGGSHDRTDLLPLKAGVVIMALGAMSANTNLNVRIVPVGLSYFHPHKFRSRAVVEFGSPIDVPRELVSLFEEGGEGKRKAVGEMMDIVYDGLKGVTLAAPDYETLMVVQAGRRLYKAPGQSLSLGQTVELNRKFIYGYLKFKDEPRVMKLREDILRYNKRLRYVGLRDHQVERATRAGWRSLGLLAYRLGLLGFWGGLALPGAILNLPIIILAKLISHKKAREALAASQVKVAGRDVLATWKVLVSLGVAPVLYSFYAALATYLSHRYQWPAKHRSWMPLYALVVLPTMSYSALKFAEVGIDIYKSLPPLFVSLLPGNHKAILDLQYTRQQISADLHVLIDELAPQVWEDFEESRMIPASSAPPSTERDARLWKKSRTGKRSDVLTHPLQWMDERLFGWGRRRGSTNKRLITPEEVRSSNFGQKRTNDHDSDEADVDDDDDRSSMSSAVDDEEDDEGDYEAVFSMLNPVNLLGKGRFGASPTTPNVRRSRASSRAHSRSRSGSLNETFAEKRNRSNQDLRSLMREGGAMSPSVSRNGQSDGNGNGAVSKSPVAQNHSQPSSSVASGAARSAANGNAAATQRRHRTHSLSEDVHIQELKAAGPAARNLPFSAASQAFEIQHEGGLAAGVRPELEQMQSAETTPPDTPPHPKPVSTNASNVAKDPKRPVA